MGDRDVVIVTRRCSLRRNSKAIMADGENEFDNEDKVSEHMADDDEKEQIRSDEIAGDSDTSGDDEEVEERTEEEEEEEEVACCNCS